MLTISKIISGVDILSKHLCWISVLLLFLELGFGVSNSWDEKVYLFLWAERAIATFFLCEYLFRVYEDWKHPELTPDIGLGKRYITSFIGMIDLMSFLPFIVGFFVPLNWLGFIRALRVIRLFKLFRYNEYLQLIAKGMYRSWPYLKPLAAGIVILTLFNAVMIHECEKVAQPDSFGYIGNCIWFSFVSCATVGYGDMSPKTPEGKIITVVFNFVPAIFVFSGMVGVAGGMFLETIKEKIECESKKKLS